jgi:hypothetical protein
MFDEFAQLVSSLWSTGFTVKKTEMIDDIHCQYYVQNPCMILRCLGVPAYGNCMGVAARITPLVFWIFNTDKYINDFM